MFFQHDYHRQFTNEPIIEPVNDTKEEFFIVLI